MGILIAVIPPIVWAAADMFSTFQIAAKSKADLGAMIRATLASGINSVSFGFTGIKPFGSNILGVNQETGQQVSIPIVATSISGGWWITTTTGVTMLVTDWVSSTLVNLASRKKRGVRMGGFQLTAGR
jgi:hypothetical protein